MRLRQQIESAAPARRQVETPVTEEAAPPKVEATEKVRAPLPLRMLRLMCLLGVALAILGVGLSLTTGLTPLQWARTADMRAAYGPENLAYVRARALLAVGALGPTLDTIETLPAESEGREELLAELFPRALATGDPDLILRAAAQGAGANGRLVVAMPAVVGKLGAEGVHTLLEAPRYAAFRDTVNSLLITGEADLAVATARLEWLTPGAIKDASIQYILQGHLNQNRLAEARALVGRLTTPTGKFNALTTLVPSYIKAGDLEEARSVLLAAQPLRQEKTGAPLDFNLQDLALHYQQKGGTERALELVEAIREPRQRYAAVTMLLSAFKSTESDAQIARLVQILKGTAQPRFELERDSLYQQLAQKCPSRERALALTQKIQDPQRRFSGYSTLAGSLTGTESDSVLDRVLAGLRGTGQSQVAAQLDYLLQAWIRRNATEGRKPVARHLLERYGSLIPETARQYWQRELAG